MPEAGVSRFRDDSERLDPWLDFPPRDPGRGRRAERRSAPRAARPVRAAEPVAARRARERPTAAGRVDVAARRAERLAARPYDAHPAERLAERWR